MPNRTGVVDFRLLLWVIVVAAAAAGAGFLMGLWLGG